MIVMMVMVLILGFVCMSNSLSPLAHRILVFCNFGPVNFSGLKFVFFEKKKLACVERGAHLQFDLLGNVPWTYPRTFWSSDCSLFLTGGSLCRVLRLIYAAIRTLAVVPV